METKTYSTFSWQQANGERVSSVCLDAESHIRQCTSPVLPLPKENTWIRSSLLPHRTRSGFQNGALQDKNQHLRTGSCGRVFGVSTATATFLPSSPLGRWEYPDHRVWPRLLDKEQNVVYRQSYQSIHAYILLIQGRTRSGGLYTYLGEVNIILIKVVPITVDKV
jgi:hypothetical protein